MNRTRRGGTNLVEKNPRLLTRGTVDAKLVSDAPTSEPKGQVRLTLALSGAHPAELIHHLAVSSTIWHLFVLACTQTSAVAGAGGL
jgi:hypothetical protein